MLKNARRLKQLTQKQLAKKLGISQPYLSQLENVKKYADINVTVNLIKRISAELELDPVKVFIYFLDSK